jgi:hypothetical protein
MIYNGYELLEYTSPDRRGPSFQAARDSGSVERFYRLRAAGSVVDPAYLIGAHAAILGYSSAEEQAVTVNAVAGVRRFIARYPPHGLAPVGDPPPPGNGYSGGESQNSTSLNYLYAHAIEECVPVSGHVRTFFGSAAALPAAADHGFAHRVVYKNFPYQILADGDVRASGQATNPLSSSFLSGGFPVVVTDGTNPALPDEGDMLRQGWLTYTRYIVKRIKDKTRHISMPAGIAYFDLEPGYGADATPAGLPIVQPRQEVTYTWVQVPVDAIPVNAIDYNRQRTNGVVFDGYPVGTLLMNGVDYEGPYQAGHGNRWYVDLSYRMEYLPNRDPPTGEFRGWNSFPRAAGGVVRYWRYSADRTGVAAAEGSRVFQRNGNFSALFRPDQAAPFATAGGYPAGLY